MIRTSTGPIVAEVMSQVVVTVEPETPISVATRKVVAIDEEAPLCEAARLLLELGIRRLVVRRGERLAGILTATDVLKWVARPALEALSTD